MDYRIIEKPAFAVAVTKRQFTTTNGQNFIQIPEWWEDFLRSPDCEKMMSLTQSKPGTVTGGTMLGLCFADEKPVEFYYGIGVELPENTPAEPFEMMEIPAATWAVFDCTIPTIQDVTKRIFSEWFPSTGYDHAPKPEIEVYFPEEPVSKVMRCQVWIPIIKRNKK